MNHYFKLPEEIEDDRSIFVNRICYLIYNTFELNQTTQRPTEINKIFEMLKPFHMGFEDCIQNFYEIVETEIPLVALFLLRLKDEAIENYGFQNEQEYLDAWQHSLNACLSYYGDKSLFKPEI